MTNSRRAQCPTEPSNTSNSHFHRFAYKLLTADPTESFLLAWKRGISLAGHHLFEEFTQFGETLSEHDECNSHQNLALVPKLNLIRHAIGPMTPAEKIFLSALVSFCYVAPGGQLLTRCEFKGFADLSRLDLSRRQVLAALTLHLQSQPNSSTTEQTPDWPPPPPSEDASPWDLANWEIRFFNHAPAAFLKSWICGVKIAGAHFFGRGPTPELDTERDKWNLCPKVGVIAAAFDSLDRSEQIFLATLVSFYNSFDGGQLLQKAGFRGFADLAHLDHLPRAVIAGLILNYTGW